jgi:small subunit ribosomal protein S1
MNPKTTRRRRDEGERPEAATSAPTPAPQRAAPPAPRPAPAPRSVAAAPADPAPRLDPLDLHALASMDPSELAALMEGSAAKRQLEVGTKVRGRVTRIGREAAFIDISGKVDAWIALDELESVQIGDTVEAFVLAAGEEGVRLSRQLRGPAAAIFLEEAAEARLPVEGKISGHNAGGFEVRIGPARAFCPFSQMERSYAGPPEEWVGKTLQFLVLETEGKTVLSRRALAAAEAKAAAEDLWSRIAEDATFEGTVTSIQTFGVFVDLGGADGLIPRRELAGGADVDPATLVSKGQRLAVRVIAADPATKKITLAPSEAFESPWTQRVGSEFVTGGTYPARVLRIEEYGAFMQLAPGIDGLLHPSRITGGRAAMPSVGSELQVKIAEIDENRHRIALASADWEAPAGAVRGAQLSGTVREVLRNGVAVDLDDGRTGWLPAKEIDLPAGTVLAQRFRRGRKITAHLLEEEDGGRRVNLTQRTDADEGAGAWRSRPKGEAAGFGTLGDLLKGWKK